MGTGIPIQIFQFVFTNLKQLFVNPGCVANPELFDVIYFDENTFSHAGGREAKKISKKKKKHLKRNLYKKYGK